MNSVDKRSRPGRDGGWGLQTLAVHAGEDRTVLDVAPPIRMTSAFRFESAQAAAQAFESEDRPIYTRWGNPTLSLLEDKVAALEGGEAGLATASGMAAASTALMTVLRAGDHVVATKGIYSGTHHFILEDLPGLGVESTLVEAADADGFGAALRPSTRAIYLESPGNPALDLNDLGAIAATARARSVTTIIDNTFASPYNQRPLECGVDVVVHSATKYLGGHGDAVGGLIVGTRDFIERARRGPLRNLGGIMSPFNAWLIARGVQTFPLRMARHNASAAEIAVWLAEHPQVAWVRYPWHPTHPQYELALRQMPGGGGGVVVFELKGGLEAGARLLDRVRLCTRTVSLGDVRTLLTHPASTTHHSLERAARFDAGISDGLVRIAVGLEDVEDLLDDLDRALR